jgi:surfactin synthase thioesterase subunit
MTRPALDGDRRWLKRYSRRDGPPRIHLLCFHHAGGNAATFRQWPHLLPEDIEPVAVQLPGRSDRFLEPPYDRMTPLVDDLIEVVEPLLDRPFACYGVSMGARVAWSFVHALRDRAMPQPLALYVACNSAPVFDDGTRPWEGHQGGLEGYLREMGGTPAEVLAEPKLLTALLATLHADLSVLESHHVGQARPLDVRIRAFAATDDSEAPGDRVGGWRAETSVRFDLDMVHGGHFFDSTGERQVTRTIGGDLARARQLNSVW